MVVFVAMDVEMVLSRALFYAVSLSLALAGCARDDSAELRARLDRWFELQDTVYFKSKKRCTVAAFLVETATPRETLPVISDFETAIAQFRDGRIAAIRMEAHSPHDITDAMLLTGDGAFGKEALAAVSQSVACFKGTQAEGTLLQAMTRRGATLAYDKDSEGLMILDPGAMAVFYVAGDVW